jgi:hypothetical protein
MTITPVEIRHVKLKRGLGGYSRKATDGLLMDVVTSYEEAWRRFRVAQLERSAREVEDTGEIELPGQAA